MSKIKFLIMDVDGTLTDGKIYISAHGEIFKAFDVKDGYGINSILRKHGVLPVIITGRTSDIVVKRAEELNIQLVYQGVSDKKEVLRQILEVVSAEEGKAYSFENCAYIGDDIPDAECMKIIKDAGGMTACPADAIPEIKQFADFKCKHIAGKGAVREFIDYIVR